MSHFSRWLGFWWLLAGLWLSGDAECFAQGTPRPRREVKIGEIAGAEYVAGESRFLLYATAGGSLDSATLYADDVVKLALAAFLYGDFSFALYPRGDRLEIAYWPPEYEQQLKSLFQGSTVEATFLYTDRVLKDLANCEPVASGLRLGACALFLCAQESAREAGTGKSRAVTGHLSYFDLEMDTEFRGYRGRSVSYKDARIVVKAPAADEGELPRCVRTFNDTLTDAMPQLLSHKRLGPEFRRLKILLQLGQTTAWARAASVPARTDLLESYRCRSVKAEPIRIRHYPMDGAGEAIWSGGILLRGGSLFTPVEQASGKTPRAAGQGSQAHFAVNTVQKDGRTLLQIDLSALLGLSP